MPSLSRKKIAFWIIAAYCLFHPAQVRECIRAFGWGLHDSLWPFWECSRDERYVLTLTGLALLYVSIYKTINNRRQ
jgi:hypothetical protein